MNKPRANRVKGEERVLNIPPFLFLFLRFQSATRKIGRRDLLNTHVRARFRLKLIWITKVHFSALCVYIYLCVLPSIKKIKSKCEKKLTLRRAQEMVSDHQFSYSSIVVNCSYIYWIEILIITSKVYFLNNHHLKILLFMK